MAMCDSEFNGEEQWDDESLPSSEHCSEYELREDLPRGTASEEPIGPYPRSPPLSTIPEESRLDSEHGVNIMSPIPLNCASTSSSKLFSPEQFRSGSAAEAMLKNCEIQMNGVPFIQDDPRFNETHHSKENSWEPSLYITPPKQEPTVKSTLSRRSSASVGVDVDPFDVSLGSVNTAAFKKDTQTVVPARIAALKDQHQKTTPFLGSDRSPFAADSMIINKQMSTPQPVVAGKRTDRKSLQRSLEERFCDISAIPPGESVRRALKFDGPSVAEVSTNLTRANDSTLDEEVIRRRLKDMPANANDDHCLGLISNLRDRTRISRSKPNFAHSVTGNASISGSKGSPSAMQKCVSFAPLPGPKTDSSQAVTKMSALNENTVELCSRDPSMSRQGQLSTLQRPTSAASSVNSHFHGTHSGSSKIENDATGMIGSLRRLYYGCIAINSSLTQTYVLTNQGCSDATVTTRMRRGKFFKIINGYGPAVVAPGATHSVIVEFEPRDNARFADQLVVVMHRDGREAVFKVPCVGLGGLAAVSLSPSNCLSSRTNGDYVLRTDDLNCFTFELNNSSQRHAFVKILCVQAGGKSFDFVMNPSSFVLNKGCIQKVEVKIGGVHASKPNTSRALQTSEFGESTSARLVIYWAEEVLRKRANLFVASCKSGPSGLQSLPCGPINGPFVGEDTEAYKIPADYPIKTQDFSVLKRALRTITIHICPSRNATSHLDLTLDEGPIELRECDETLESTFSRTMVPDVDKTILARPSS